MGKARAKRKTEEVLVALLEHPTLARAAAALNVSEVTLWRWSQKPEFREAFRKARRDAFSQAVARLQNASSAAAATLLRVMLDQSAPAASRVRAADCVLQHAVRAMEIEDLEIRIQHLEQWQDH